jgi:hypothetical protein
VTDTPTRKPGRRPDPATAILGQVRAARKALESRPFRGGRNPGAALSVYAERAEAWRAINAAREHAGLPGRDGDLLEAVYAALAASDSEARELLVRLASVAVAAVEELEEASR